VGSAAAHVLFRQGYTVLLVEAEQPTSPRRGMCWVDAVFDGIAVLDHLSAVRVFHPADAALAFARRIWLPLVVAPTCRCGCASSARRSWSMRGCANTPRHSPICARCAGVQRPRSALVQDIPWAITPMW
jgi:hypothetical protein